MNVTPALRLYGLAAWVLGVTAAIFNDMATIWHPLQPGVPFRSFIIGAFALVMIVGGIGVQFGAFARPSLIALASGYAFCALLWLPRMIGYPQIYGVWGGAIENFAMTAAVATLFVPAARFIYGACVASYGISHLTALSETAQLVPPFMPFGQTFWAVATAFAFLAAAVAILTGWHASLGARMLAVMLGVFGALVWLPKLFAFPTAHAAWAGNAMNLAALASAWLVADHLQPRNEART